MGQVLFSNNADAVLSAPITAAATSISVQAGQGAKFPPIAGGSGDWFPMTLRSASAMEVVRCTAHTGTSDVFTVIRAQEGTVGTAFAAGDLCQLRFTTAAMLEVIARIAAVESALTMQFVTGDTKYRPGTATITGWVRANGFSIGNAASAATERANADTVNLFTLLWTTFADAQCPVSGGRGASAAADFAANKRLTLPDAAGRAFICLDNLGGGVKNRLTVNTATPNGTTPGATGGGETRALAITNLPAHDHPITSATGTATANGDHNHGGATATDGLHTHTGGTTNNIGAHTHPGSVTDTEAAHTHPGSVTDTEAAHDHGGAVTGSGAHSHGNITDSSNNNFEVFVGSVSSGSRRIVQDSVESGGAGSGNLKVADSTGGHVHGISNDGSHSHAVTVGNGGSHAHVVTVASDGNHSHTVTVPNTGSTHSHVINNSGTHTHPVTLTIDIGNTGSGTAFDNMGPFIALGTLYLKL